jgi:hypothetical protein
VFEASYPGIDTVMRIHKLLLSILVTAAAANLAVAQPPAKNPKDKLFGGKLPSEEDPNGRSLQGAVTNEAGALLDGAVVTLKNLKSSKERSFITKQEGTYRFDSLRMDADYEMTARYQGSVSETKKLSMYDSRKQAVRNFVIPNKPETPAK